MNEAPLRQHAWKFFLAGGVDQVALRSGADLASILDANGWAINTKAKMNVPFGSALTNVAKLPANAECSLDDPYAEKQRLWKAYVVLLAIVALGYCWSIGKLDDCLPEPVKSTHIFPAAAK
jgi:hypothetical protein